MRLGSLFAAEKLDRHEQICPAILGETSEPFSPRTCRVWLLDLGLPPAVRPFSGSGIWSELSELTSVTPYIYKRTLSVPKDHRNTQEQISPVKMGTVKAWPHRARSRSRRVNATQTLWCCTLLILLLWPHQVHSVDATHPVLGNAKRNANADALPRRARCGPAFTFENVT